MDDSDRLEAAKGLRRTMLGEEYVDAQTADPNPRLREFQDYVPSTAWGVWARAGALSTRDRSLLVLAMTAALGRTEEFALHARSALRAGVTDDELEELTFETAAYCGAPAGIAPRRVLREARAAREE